MNNIKELEIPKELYIEALEINSMVLSTDEKINKESYKRAEVFELKHHYDIFDIIMEYQRRENNIDKQLNELQEQDKNTYRITFANGKILEMKVKCIGCVYNEEINQVLTIDYNLKYSVLENDVFNGVKTIECIERNNNLDLSKDKQWWLKLSIDI